ncbi:hypoxanthine phosphoribosyltransferase [Marinobacter halodurans]|uniref:Hypoxanthine phosphoribosyltransferase n=1 Tax=Marinobacter halodurans TaxID=2528979 RepID=A0ABY1ZKL3_9GAMM|nr:phosphoribosyltransferase family protein [Marinobacter halodurans]TBW53351.1 hypoxanthine phosphoribosyltransferase [Marinobacter halodurans]
MINKCIGEMVLGPQAIQEGVEAVASQLNEQFTDAVLIVVVPGGIFFAADLARLLKFEVSIDYISCPHEPGKRSNESEIVYHRNIDVEGKDVIVVDDAIESGGTMKRLVHYLSTNYRPRSLSTATLLVKPGRVEIPVRQHFGYEMPNDDLLVGYGLPWENRFRNLPYVSKLVG